MINTSLLVKASETHWLDQFDPEKSLEAYGDWCRRHPESQGRLARIHLLEFP